MEILPQFKQDVAGLDSINKLRDRFSSDIKLIGYHGFDAFSARKGSEVLSHKETNLFICDYSIDVLVPYLSGGLVEMDPVVAEIARANKPFDFVAHLRSAQKNTSVVWQLGMLRLFGVHHAWLVPMCTLGHIRGMTIYMKGKGRDDQRRFEETRDEICLICMEFMDRFVQLSHQPSAENEPLENFDRSIITQRETDCLHWAARGKTNREIGNLLNISENTVRYHLKNVFSKLHAKSRSSAVSRALREGIIEL